MGFRFRRSVKILPGVKLNFGKKGVSISAGVRGAHVTVSKDGTRTTIGAPGTGMSYTNFAPHGGKNSGGSNSNSVPYWHECPYCGRRMRKLWEACPDCGSVLPPLTSCPDCGMVFARDTVNYCPACGHCVRDDLISVDDIDVDLSQITDEEMKERNARWCKCGMLLTPDMRYCPICGKRQESEFERLFIKVGLITIGAFVSIFIFLVIGVNLTR